MYCMHMVKRILIVCSMILYFALAFQIIHCQHKFTPCFQGHWGFGVPELTGIYDGGLKDKIDQARRTIPWIHVVMSCFSAVLLNRNMLGSDFNKMFVFWNKINQKINKKLLFHFAFFLIKFRIIIWTKHVQLQWICLERITQISRTKTEFCLK